MEDAGLKVGNTINQMGTQASGTLVGTAGTAAGSNLTITNAGIGYTPASWSNCQLMLELHLVSLTGKGRGATASITIQRWINSCSLELPLLTGGSGYQIGDVLGISTIGSVSIGRDARLTVASIGATSELIFNECSRKLCCWVC